MENKTKVLVQEKSTVSARRKSGRRRRKEEGKGSQREGKLEGRQGSRVLMVGRGLRSLG